STVNTLMRFRNSITSGNWKLTPKPSGSSSTNDSQSVSRGRISVPKDSAMLKKKFNTGGNTKKNARAAPARNSASENGKNTWMYFFSWGYKPAATNCHKK